VAVFLVILMIILREYQYTDILKNHYFYIFLELLKNTSELSENINYWRTLFKDEAVVDTAPIYIKIANKILEYQNFDRRERTAVDMSSRYRDKIEAEIAYGRNEGEKIGERKGIITTAKKIILKGFETVIISEVTGLPQDEIIKLK